MDNTFLKNLKHNIAATRSELLAHPVYTQIKTIEHLQLFAEAHVFAVWDFMSLLKSLQRNLTCVTLPWQPVGSADTRFLINEIVVGEESDIDMNGVRTSHFELYQTAMLQCGADTTLINNVIIEINKGKSVQDAMAACNVPMGVQNFVNFTFEVIATNKAHIQAAVFTFGREDLIPDMFMSLVADMNKRFPYTVNIFKYYLDRHIEVDGDHHSHLALQMTAELCGNDVTKWAEAETYVIKALQARIHLWNSISEAIEAQSSAFANN